MTPPNILMVEDDPPIRTLTARALQEHGYIVRTAGTAPQMWDALRAAPADLLLLDIMLPGTSGIDICREVRRTSDVPIIFLSAKGTETDRIGVRELVARVRAVLRRHAIERPVADRERGLIRFDDWTADLPRRQLTSPDGAAVELTGAEFDLLVSLCDNAQRVIARERLIELSRTRLGDSSDRSIDVLISRLRRKLSNPGKPAPIVTVRGIGYMLNVPVERL